MLTCILMLLQPLFTDTPLHCQRLSVFGCSATIIGAPVLVFLGPDASSLMAKASIALTLCSFGVFSTGASFCRSSPSAPQAPKGLHWLGACA